VYSASQIALVLSARSLPLQQSKAQKPSGFLSAVEEGVLWDAFFVPAICSRVIQMDFNKKIVDIF